VAIAAQLGWSPARIEETRAAALLHDLGKLSVPNSILDKPGALDPSEWEIMRMHALYTERILEHVKGFEWFAFASASHHERMDGTGYCRGLDGDALPELSRVLAVADVYDALSAPRPYRHALSPEEVFVIMDRDGAKGFCPSCYDALKIVTCDGEVEPGGEERDDTAQAA
jgi:HD-GYP domain-containing protein (c-di-GMP phosphodiesterase class II)